MTGFTAILTVVLQISLLGISTVILLIGSKDIGECFKIFLMGVTLLMAHWMWIVHEHD